MVLSHAVGGGYFVLLVGAAPLGLLRISLVLLWENPRPPKCSK